MTERYVTISVFVYLRILKIESNIEFIIDFSVNFMISIF